MTDSSDDTSPGTDAAADAADGSGDGDEDGSGDDEALSASELAAVDTDVLFMSPAEREERGVTDDDVHEAFLAVLEHGHRTDKHLQGVVLPAIDLDYAVVAGADRHPVDLTGATIEGDFSAAHADVRLPLVLDDVTVESLSLDEARFGQNVSLQGATVTGEVSADETHFAQNLDATGVRFEGPVHADEAVVDDETRLRDASFAADASFRGTTFHGRSNLLEDNATFAGATFHGEADFRQATLGFCHFDGVTFEGDALFEETHFEGDADFTGATFRGLADFDEADFDEDTTFADVAFHGLVDFRGAEFHGGARVLEADTTFEGATFHDEADFRRALFRFASFADVTFSAPVTFEQATFRADAEFPGATFAAEADFDETRYLEDADFTETHFAGSCDFRGAEFQGGDNHLEEDATFKGARFDADVDFDNAWFESANFTDTRFGGQMDFSKVVFEDRVAFSAVETAPDAYVDFTGAKLKRGVIAQPSDAWVRYDMTTASLGDVQLAAARDEDRRELLDYFRFCNTEFDEFDGLSFDFSDHARYLDRNDWVLHTFDDPGDGVSYAVETTPENVETTYLKAKNAASSAGDMKAAGEFRVKRQQYARRKHLAVARDATASVAARVKNASRAVENAFLGITCGHGMRLLRIATVFAVVPLFIAFAYAFGGLLTGSSEFRTSAGEIDAWSMLGTPEGNRILFENVHFSYISYTTIGYGNLSPVGAYARILAGSEAYLSTILAALVVYALVKRSEL